MSYRLLRNATALLTVGRRTFLIDPAFDAAGERPAVPNTPARRPNPLVEMPAGWRKAIARADAAVVTHTHMDHWDATAAATLDHGMPMFCQPEDEERLGAAGLTDVRAVGMEAELDGVRMIRTAGRHGTGEIGRLMAPVSGFVFRSAGEPVVYVAGDTIWCDEVSAAIATHRPDVIVVNASGARFLRGDPIVMTAEDVAQVHAAAPGALVIVVHLEAINHCLETREHYRARLPELGVKMERVRIPDHGERVRW